MEIDSEMMFGNHVTTTHPVRPFGGTKRSGYGIKEFVYIKIICIQDR
jgi:acyl-CoA reductase-like NAD-dependent aldehyde dehydrogenase